MHCTDGNWFYSHWFIACKWDGNIIFSASQTHDSLLINFFLCHTCVFSTSPQRPDMVLCLSGLGCCSYELLSHEVFVTSVILALIPLVGAGTWRDGHRALKSKPHLSHWNNSRLVLSDCLSYSFLHNARCSQHPTPTILKCISTPVSLWSSHCCCFPVTI